MANTVKRQLAVLSRASVALSQAKTLAEVKGIRDKAEAARCYAKSAVLGLQIQNHAAELKLRAERRAGEILSQMELSHGGRPGKNRSQDATGLAELGVNKSQSSRWQREAQVPIELFERYLALANSSGREVTTQGVLRLAAVVRKRTTVDHGASLKGRAGGASRTDVGAPMPSDAGHRDTAAVLEILAELESHQAMLTETLGQLLPSFSDGCRRTHERYVARKLLEMRELVARLRRILIS